MYSIEMTDSFVPYSEGKCYLFNGISLPTERDIQKGGCISPIIFDVAIYIESLCKDYEYIGFDKKSDCAEFIKTLEKIQSFKTFEPRNDWKFKPIKIENNKTKAYKISNKDIEKYKQDIIANEEIIKKYRIEYRGQPKEIKGVKKK